MEQSIDIRSHNRAAWNLAVERKSQWTLPVDAMTIEQARQGSWQIKLTPTKAVPRSWFPDFSAAEILCLASGGGQQGPVLAAAGASAGACVTVFDNSPSQLAQDRYVAAREGLNLCAIEGDMQDLSVFPDRHFDLIVNPCSNLFIPDVRPLWRECSRVLKNGGVLLAGFVNPLLYLFDQDKLDEGVLEVCHRLPYSDLTSIAEKEMQAYVRAGEALEFGHTLTDQIAGQLDAGFALTGFYEDRWEGQPPADFTDTYIATRSVRQYSNA